MPAFTEPSIVIRCGHGQEGHVRRIAYHAAAHRAQTTLNRWARQALDAAADENLPPRMDEEPPSEFCDE